MQLKAFFLREYTFSLLNYVVYVLYKNVHFLSLLNYVVYVGGFPIHPSYASCTTNILGTHAKGTPTIIVTIILILMIG